jgi:hypothetical protein
MVRGAVLLISGFFSSAALAQSVVVFAAPKQMRAEISAALKEKGKTPIDQSELDTAMYAPKDGAKYQVAAGKMVTLKASFPKEVRADFAAGQAACRARADQSAEGRLACAQQLVDAVWERQLDRVKAELVLEFRVDEMLLELAMYHPGDATISGGAALWEEKPTPRQFVGYALEGAIQARVGTRSMSRDLPTATDPAPPPASLSQGAPQSLSAIEVPNGCTLPSDLQVEPATVPLAITISTLWRATAATHAKQGAKPASCTLALGGESARPGAVNFTCGNELASLPLQATTRFGDKSYQAELAKMFVTGQVAAQCAAAAPPVKK